MAKKIVSSLKIKLTVAIAKVLKEHKTILTKKIDKIIKKSINKIVNKTEKKIEKAIQKA